jgi:shikimate dehydrogenase
LYDVDPERAEALAQRVRCHHAGAQVDVTMEPVAVASSVQGLVNTTPVGMAKVPGSPICLDLLRPTMWVADIIYFPAETELLRAARKLGCRTMNGGGMAVCQAVKAFHAFTSRHADPIRMRQHFQDLCGRVA